MTEQREKTLDLLRELTPFSLEKRAERSLVLLPYCSSFPEGKNHLPGGFCECWVFSVGRHFSAALDVMLQKRMRKKTPYWAWTQGSLFYFREGYCLYKNDGSLLLQVESAKPSSPASYEQEAWPEPPEDIQTRLSTLEWDGIPHQYFEDPKAKAGERYKLRTFTDRGAGHVRLKRFGPKDKAGTWKSQGTMDMTQDELVHLLIAGQAMGGA